MGISGLDHTVQSYFVRSLSPNTLQSYKSAANCYLVLCHSFGISLPFPLFEVVLGRFMAYLAYKRLSYITIRVYVSALQFTPIASGLPDFSLFSFPHLDYVLRGTWRLLPQHKRPKRLPITPDILWRFFRVWFCPPVSYDRIMFRAACCIGFFSFLRSGEFTCPPSAVTSGHVLSVSDVTVDTIQSFFYFCPVA